MYMAEWRDSIMVSKTIDEQQLKAVCDILGETYQGLTKTQLTQLLQQSKIDILSDGSSSNGYAYQIGLNKRDWLYNCLAGNINKTHSLVSVYTFFEKALNPVSYTKEKDRDQYHYLIEGVNKVLVLAGLEVTNEGKLVEVIQAKSLDEVDRRVNSLQRQLYNRSIHDEVRRYFIKDYLRKDYYDAVFEAAKGLAERVRQITGLTVDGNALFQTAFSTGNPYLFFNRLETDSERNEFIGLKELCEAIFHLIRNPVAHTPKINWKIDETKALDVLTLISFAHKYLDECHKVPRI